NTDSAVCRLDRRAGLTHEPKYTTAADRVYRWLMGTAYDRGAHAFTRGGTLRGGRWLPDGHELFAPDTAFWAPLERMRTDESLGKTAADRVEEIAAAVDTAERWAGVTAYGELRGISFARAPAQEGIISPEWSAQCAVRRLRLG